MTFEEQFPSLKHTGINCGLSDIEKETKELLTNHCIDKQRTFEIIRVVLNKDTAESLIDFIENGGYDGI